VQKDNKHHQISLILMKYLMKLDDDDDLHSILSTILQQFDRGFLTVIPLLTYGHKPDDIVLSTGSAVSFLAIAPGAKIPNKFAQLAVSHIL